MSDGSIDQRLAAEARARVLIDQLLAQAGWVVQDKKNLNLFAGQGVAVREVVMKPGHGRVDYLLYVEKAVVGVRGQAAGHAAVGCRVAVRDVRGRPAY